MEQFGKIALNDIIINGEQPRKTFKDNSLKELAASIKANGVLQPVMVREKDAGGKYALIAGERRVRASLLAGEIDIPATIRNDSDEKILQLQIIENLQRESINFFEEAEAIKMMRDRLDMDVTEIRKILGKSDMYIYCQLQLAASPQELKDAAAAGHLSKDVTWQIARLPNDEYKVTAVHALARTNRNELVAGAAAKKWINEKFSGKTSKRGKNNGVQAAIGNDFKANWKKHLLTLDGDEWEAFKRICRGRTDVDIFIDGIDILMSKRASAEAAAA